MVFEGSISVDENKCSGCGECVNVCPAAVYEILDSRSKPKHVRDCIECCACVEVCEPEAIAHSSC